jgi:signal transduction histidine kinase
LTAHDVVIALQVVIAEIEVLKIEMKKAFGIGQKWEDRFENLISACEGHNWYLKARLELDKPHYEEESISKLIYEVVDLYSPKAKERGIEIFLDLEQLKAETGKHKVLTIRMNRDALKNAFSNALDNAIKYSFEGTASNPRWVEIVGKLKKVKRVLGYNIAISNLGVGIEEDEIEAVFRPGYQGRQRLYTGHAGFGMGLTILREYVEKHGGQVKINSISQTRSAWLTTLDIWLPLHSPVGRSKESSDG